MGAAGTAHMVDSLVAAVGEPTFASSLPAIRADEPWCARVGFWPSHAVSPVSKAVVGMWTGAADNS